MPDYINYTNIRSNAGTSWQGSAGIGSSGSKVYYVIAPVFYAYFSIEGSGLWGYEEGSFYVDYWNGTSWQNNVYGSYQEVRASWNSYGWTFNHNYNSQPASSGDVPTKHFWRIRTYASGDGSVSGNLYWGSIGMLTESFYNTNFKKELMKSIAVTVTTADYSAGTNIDGALGSGYLRGDKITTSRAKYLCAYP